MSMNKHGVSLTQGVIQRGSVNGQKRNKADVFDALTKENCRLANENEKIRQCLQLTKENCQLHTLNYLSYVMTLNDAKLRTFLTDAITSAPRKDMLQQLHTVQNSTLGKGQRDIQHVDKRKPIPLRNETKIEDSTTGQPFTETHLSDTRSSYDERNASDSYGKSFPSINLNELDDTYDETKTHLQSQKAPTVQWVAYDDNDDEIQHVHRKTHLHSPSSTKPPHRSKSPGRSSRGRTRSSSRGRSQRSPNNQFAPDSHSKRSQPGMRHSHGFYDSLEATKHTGYGQAVLPNSDQNPDSRPPMRFGLNPNPMWQSPYADVSKDRKDVRANVSTPIKHSSRGHHCSSSGFTSPDSIRMSDLEHAKGMSMHKQHAPVDHVTYRHFKPGTTQQNNDPRNDSIDIQKCFNQCHNERDDVEAKCECGYCVCKTPNKSAWVSINSAKKTLESQFEKKRDVSFERAYTSAERGEIVCPTCRSTVTSMSQQDKNNTRRLSPVCKHIVKDDSVPTSPELLVRVNTTFGQPCNNNLPQTTRFSDQHTVPDMTDATKRVEYTDVQAARLIHTPMVNQSGVSSEREKTLNDQQSQWLNQNTMKERYNTQSLGNTTYHVAMTNGIQSGAQYTPTQMTAHLNNVAAATQDYCPPGSVYRTDQGNFQSSTHGVQGQPYTPIASVFSPSDYRNATMFDRDSLEPVTPRTDNATTHRMHQDKVLVDNGGIIHQPSNRGTTYIGDPIAMSTPVRSPNNKKKRFMTEQQSNLPQVENLMTSPSETSFETNHTRMYSKDYPSPYGDLLNSQPITDSDQPHHPTDKRRASAPPMRLRSDDEATEKPSKTTKGRESKSTATTPEPKRDSEWEHDVSLADAAEFAGPSAKEKAKGYFYRPVDILICYTPRFTPESYRQLQTTVSSRRMVGEIAFQLDRRILEFVMTGYKTKPKKASFRYYGYSLNNITKLITKKANREDESNPRIELILRNRFALIMKRLRPLGYIFDIHAEFTQDMVNKYGLLNISDDNTAVQRYGLTDIGMTRLKLCKILKIQRELENMMVIFDSLCLLAFEDGRSVFIF